MGMTFTKQFDRYNQIWFGLRGLFPRWHDWNIKYTRKEIVYTIHNIIVKGLVEENTLGPLGVNVVLWLNYMHSIIYFICISRHCMYVIQPIKSEINQLIFTFFF